MVTINKYFGKDNITSVDLIGLSTDTKPTSSVNGITLKNGSTFLAMDTSQVFMYDEQNNTWHEIGG